MIKKILLMLSIMIALPVSFIKSMEEEDSDKKKKEPAKETRITLISKDDQEFGISRALAEHIGSHQEEIGREDRIRLNAPGSIVCSIVLLLKCLETAGHEHNHTDYVFFIVKNIRNPKTLADLVTYCTQLALPACILAGLQRRITMGFSVQELLDNEITFPMLPVGTLNLSGKMLTSLAGLALVPGIKTVEALNLSDNQLEHLDPYALKACKQIKRLFLNNNRIGQLTKEDLAVLPKLEQLDCRGNQLVSIPEGLFRKSKKLSWVDFDNNHIGHVSPKTFSGIQHVFLEGNPCAKK